MATTWHLFTISCVASVCPSSPGKIIRSDTSPLVCHILTLDPSLIEQQPAFGIPGFTCKCDRFHKGLHQASNSMSHYALYFTTVLPSSDAPSSGWVPAASGLLGRGVLYDLQKWSKQSSTLKDYSQNPWSFPANVSQLIISQMTSINEVWEFCWHMRHHCIRFQEIKTWHKEHKIKNGSSCSCPPTASHGSRRVAQWQLPDKHGCVIFLARSFQDAFLNASGT